MSSDLFYTLLLMDERERPTRLLTADDVCERLRVSKPTVYRRVARESLMKLPCGND
jgi:predicted DNA-binding transcriptional regulator AlpA